MASEPVTVLSLGLTTEERDAVADIERVRSVTCSTSDSLRDRLAADRPSCVVVGHDPPAIDGVDIVEWVVDADPDLPVVVFAESDDDTLAADVVSVGATGYVPRRRGSGALAEAIGTALETGQRRRRQARDSAMLTEILHRAPFEIYVKDADARHLRSTKTVRHDDAAGKTEPEFADEGRAEEIYRKDRRALEQREPIVGDLSRYEVRSHAIDNHDSGWLRSWKYPWYDDGKLQGLVGFTQDVTGVEETSRELTQKNRVLSQFASVVSHDLRNPLNIAQGYLEIARETGDEETFDDIEQSHRRMNEIIEDLIRLTRDSSPSSSQSSLEIAAAARHAWGTVDTGSSTLRVDAGAELIVADDGLLQQIFENLFRNAVEHGGEDVTVTVGLEPDLGGFYVADDGPGLPTDVRERLNAGEFTDGGLGVNIVRTIADRHEWSLEASESEDGGAEFTFRGCLLISNPGTETVDRQTRTLTDAHTVGDVDPGEHRRDSNGWTVTGTGRNLWRNVNEFYFVSEVADGDVDFVGRIADFSAGNKSAKAGLMVRSGTEPGSPHGFIGCTHNMGSEALWQLESDGGTQSQLVRDDATPPIWYRLKREGNVVTTFTSEDGDEWRPVAEQRLPLEERALYGLVVVDHSRDERAVTRFEDVSLAEVSWE